MGPRSLGRQPLRGEPYASPTSRSARRSADVRSSRLGADGNDGVQGRNDLRHDGAGCMYGSRRRRQERHEEGRHGGEGRAEGREQGEGSSRRCSSTGRGVEAGRCDGDLWRRHEQQGGPRRMRAARRCEDRRCDARAERSAGTSGCKRPDADASRADTGCKCHGAGPCASSAGRPSGHRGGDDYARRQHRSHRRYRAVQGRYVLSRRESSRRVLAPSGRREVALIFA